MKEYRKYGLVFFTCLMSVYSFGDVISVNATKAGGITAANLEKVGTFGSDGHAIQVGDSNADAWARRGVMVFDLSELTLPEGQSIDSVNLNIHMYMTTGGINIGSMAVVGTPSDGEITVSDFGTTELANYGNICSTSATNGLYDVDVTDVVKAAYGTGVLEFRLQIEEDIQTDSDGLNDIYYVGSANSAGTTVPFLEITTVPEPGTMLLGISGALLLIRRKRNR